MTDTPTDADWDAMKARLREQEKRTPAERRSR